MKHLFTELKIRAIAVIGATFLWLLHLTYRWDRRGRAKDPNFWGITGPKVFVFWHDSQLFMPFVYRYISERVKVPKLYTLISQHNDGRYIASAVKLLGLDSVAGSSTRGGSEAARTLIEKVQGGEHVAITPDGPRGPRHKLKMGAIAVASRSGAPIVCVALAPSNAWRFRSWDRMFLPKPLSRLVVLMSEPIAIPSNLRDQEMLAHAKLIEDRMNALNEEAERYATA